MLQQFFSTLDGRTLKRIAVGSMLCDHLACFLLLPLLDWGILPTSSTLTILYWLGRFIGRLAFPLFCLLLTEGFYHTKSRPRYLARMLFFALVSEPVYDLASSGGFFDPTYQNVYVTLLMGLCLLTLLETAQNGFISLLALVGCCAAAELLRADFGAMGVLLIAVFWLLRDRPILRMAAAAPILAAISSVIFCAALLALIPIGLYSGKRGEERHPLFFYWFYPAHLFAISLLLQFF